jgi:hypothetical protein
MSLKEQYLALLGEYGLNEKDVAPIIRFAYWSDQNAAKLASYKNRLRPNFAREYDELRSAIIGTTPLGILEFFLKEAERREELERIEAMESGNANLVIGAIADDLRRRIRLRPDDPVYHGIFPTRVFNAQVIRRGNGYLVLIESATLELIEVIATLVTSTTTPRPAIIDGIVTTCRKYYEHLGKKISGRYLPRPVEEYERELKTTAEEYAAGVALTTAAEEFAIALEWGHIVLGHALTDTHCTLGVGEKLKQVDQTNVISSQIISSQRDEFTADLWSLGMLLDGSNSSGRPTTSVEGALLFLNLARQFEGYDQIDTHRISSHPRAVDRLWMIRRLAERYSGSVKFLDGASTAIIQQILNECYTCEFGGPPEEDASLNENLLSQLYTKCMRLIFPYKKELW